MAAIPRLLANAGDICTHKILVAAQAAGVKFALEVPKRPGVPEIICGDRTIRYTNAILRYIGRLSDATDIYGGCFFESAQVDSWLDWTELELCSEESPRIADAIDCLEKHLDKRTYIVGQRFTLADVSISCSLYHFKQRGVAACSPLPQNLRRWLGTCEASDAFQAVVGFSGGSAASSAPTKGGAAAAAVAPQAAAASGPPSGGDGGVSAGTIGKSAETGMTTCYSSCVGGRTRVARILNCPDQGVSLIGQIVSVCGWVKTSRDAQKGSIMFLEINDGSCPASIQAVLDQGVKGYASLAGKCGTGASVKCTGVLVANENPKAKSKVELLVKEGDHEVVLFGGVNSEKYPLSKKQHSLEYLREMAHLRPRSNLISCVARVRSSLAMATHMFFRERGFQYVHTPCLTAADCEGAGEMFQVTTLLQKEKEKGLPKIGNDIDYTKDFFGKPTFLTVSGQLSVENYCCALSNVYTFGPTFRAEDSHTSRHLAEFWMIEPELAFADINDDMQCAEDYLKFCIRYVLEQNHDDLEFFDERVEKGLLKRLEQLLKEPFARVTYTEAIEILIKESPKANFQVPVEWGMDLNSEHERYLVEKVKKKPSIVYNYPKDIKAFYMRLNDDEKTVAAMDVLVPQIGEVIGGSQREERLDVLERRLAEMELDPKDYWWYMDLRRYGSVPHSGFGLGFERLIMLATGVENIRDTIPFPRYPGHAEF